ncbi:TIGR03915 family putative DNA repair protein [Flavobacterium rhizosphaerae]|uniref:TIGR03915 family putative DNA repair protein n=1 Tax=Flavobacterium rhizosphaerae TaxID=3163298 RepID=A0ABW8YZH7_9FLAO
MHQVVYDGTYEGWLTAVFDIYEYRLQDVIFCIEGQPNTLLFAESHNVITDTSKAKRVLNGLKKKLSPDGVKAVYSTFMSEIDNAECKILEFVRHVFSNSKNIEGDLAHPAVRKVSEAVKMMRRESHRMKAFIRFKLTKDNLYYSIVEPDCNVLPFIEGHFKSRYADQRWLIYDAKRKYGIYYDLNETNIVQLHFSKDMVSAKATTEICDEQEEFFQHLWRRYFSSVNIASRKNMKLHLQHMPKRYWKYLTEKQPESH